MVGIRSNQNSLLYSLVFVVYKQYLIYPTTTGVPARRLLLIRSALKKNEEEIQQKNHIFKNKYRYTNVQYKLKGSFFLSSRYRKNLL